MTNKQQTRYADFITQWERILVSLLANIAELPHLEAPRAKLQALLEEVRTLVTQQDLHAASKQQISQRLKTLLADGKKLATFLRTGVKEHFGNRNEKLVEFGVQPFRRVKVVKPVPTPAPQPGPVAQPPGPVASTSTPKP
ncbi:MAG TPA: hypothetical protein VFC23_04430 [Thermoanaerobaculia bacterium]|nr:hypothetical protein [Thermoanaerobaculia bacterium]